MLSHEGEERECSQDGGVKGTQEGREQAVPVLRAEHSRQKKQQQKARDLACSEGMSG